MGRITVNKVGLPARCEICHQADMIDSGGVCKRCVSVPLPCVSNQDSVLVKIITPANLFVISILMLMCCIWAFLIQKYNGELALWYMFVLLGVLFVFLMFIGGVILFISQLCGYELVKKCDLPARKQEK